MAYKALVDEKAGTYRLEYSGWPSERSLRRLTLTLAGVGAVVGLLGGVGAVKAGNPVGSAIGVAVFLILAGVVIFMMWNAKHPPTVTIQDDELISTEWFGRVRRAERTAITRIEIRTRSYPRAGPRSVPTLS
jgi:hypothetical protein